MFVRAGAACYKIIILWPLFVCHCDCASSLLAKTDNKANSQCQSVCWGNGELGAGKLSVTWGKGAEEEGRLQRESGREDTSNSDLWFITGQGAQGRQWTDLKGLKGARGSDTAGGERKMILLIKLYEVIALHATRVPSSTIGAINCVCLCVRVWMWLSVHLHVCVFLSLTHTQTQTQTLVYFY